MSLFDIDEEVITFGKYKGQTPRRIANHDPGYIVYLVEEFEGALCSQELYEECLRDARDFGDFEDEYYEDD